MKIYAINRALDAIWKVVADANRYFAAQAPWALKKTDPARMETVLYVTAEVLRQVAILIQPYMPTSAGKLLDLLAVPANARVFASLSTASRFGRRLAGAGPRFSALCGEGGGAGVTRMAIVDSHCHLDYPGLVEQIEDVLARAEDAGVGLCVSIGTRVRKFDSVLKLAEKYPQVWCTVGTHPHHAAEEPDVTARELIELSKHPKVVGIGEAGLDYHYDFSPRDLQATGLSRPYRCGPRERIALGDPQSRGRRRYRRDP